MYACRADRDRPELHPGGARAAFAPTEITLDCKDCTREANGVDHGDMVCPEGYDFY